METAIYLHSSIFIFTSISIPSGVGLLLKLGFSLSWTVGRPQVPEPCPSLAFAMSRGREEKGRGKNVGQRTGERKRDKKKRKRTRKIEREREIKQEPKRAKE